MATEDRLLPAHECAELLTVSLPTWYRLVRNGMMPPAIKLGACSRWRRADILAAAAARQTER